MREFLFQQELWLPRSPEQLFPFFADVGNLNLITPPWLCFQIVTPQPVTMRVGILIDYRLRIRTLPLRWRTRINAWEPPHYFEDEQVRGPYRRWIHQHTFEAHDGGTLTRDRVSYSVCGGGIIDQLFVRQDITRIFEFRSRALVNLFGAKMDRTDYRTEPAPG